MRLIIFIFSVFFSYHVYSMDNEPQKPGYTNLTLTVESPEQLEQLNRLIIKINSEANERIEPINAYYGDDRKQKLELEKIIRKNFIRTSEGFYIPKERCESHLEDKLRHFTKIFDYDNDLKVMLALYFYNQEINYREARILIAEAIVSEDYQTDLFGNEMPEYQRNTLKYYYEKYLHNLPVNLTAFHTFCKESIQKYMRIKQIRDDKNADTQIKSHFLKDCKSIFCEFVKGGNPILLDALFCVIKRQHRLYHWPTFMADLSSYLYEDLESKNVCPPTIKLAYANHYLIPQRKYTQAIALYQSVLGVEEYSNPDNFFQSPCNYNMFALCLMMDKQYESARRELKKAVALINDPIMEWNYACAEIGCGNYSEYSLKILKNIRNFSVEEKKKYNIDSSVVEKTYEQFLDEKERMERLLTDQQKILEKRLRLRKQQATFAKLVIEENQRLKQFEDVTPLPEKRVMANTSSTSVSAVGASYDNQNWWSSLKSEEKYNVPEIREKKKTTGVPDLEKAKKKKKTKNSDPEKGISQNATQSLQQVNQPLIYIEDLTTNKQAWTTFEKLFWKYRPDIRSDSNVSISYTEFQALFTALDQDYNPGQGKGSHEKGTLNFENSGSLMGDQMVILPTHTTHLKPEYIKSARIKFINARVVPNDPELIERLRKDGFNL